MRKLKQRQIDELDMFQYSHAARNVINLDKDNNKLLVDTKKKSRTKHHRDPTKILNLDEKDLNSTDTEAEIANVDKFITSRKEIMKLEKQFEVHLKEEPPARRPVEKRELFIE